jgi:glucokinase
MGRFFLSLDIGATKTSAAMFGPSGEIADGYVTVKRSETFKNSEEVYQNVKSALDDVLRRFPDAGEIAGIGAGCPGPLDRKTGTIIHAPLMRWKNFPLVKRLEEDFGMRVALDNDGNLGALAEQRSGAAKGLRHILYITVSTGCGGGVLIDGDIYHGAGDGAGEVGHMCIDPQGPECACGATGCFELYASGTALLNFMKRDMAAGVKSAAFDAAGGAERLSGELLTEAAAIGDPYALELYKREGYFLGVGIANLANLFDPEAVVLGGGVTKAAEFFKDELRATVKKRCVHSTGDDFIRFSGSGGRGVLYGAYFMIREHIEKTMGAER